MKGGCLLLFNVACFTNAVKFLNDGVKLPVNKVNLLTIAVKLLVLPCCEVAYQ
jgi:hypothetical protein